MTDMDQLKQDMATALGNIGEMKKDLHDIKNIISGHPLVKGDEGFVGMIRSNKKEIDELKKWKERAIYFIYGLGISSSLGVISFIKQIFHQ